MRLAMRVQAAGGKSDPMRGTDMEDRSRERRPRERGFALILAILSLMLLTFLGLTLATTTSTELQIATNYRWSQQALYNAEAGLEAGKRVLRDLEWGNLLWSPPRTAWAVEGPYTLPSVSSNADAYGNPTRTWEMGGCDKRGAQVGYGRVVDDGTIVYQNVSTIYGQQINGTVTLWVRRMLISNVAGTYQDDPSNDRLILTVEGTAPFVGGRNLAATTVDFSRKARATYRIEATLSRSENPGGGDCGTRAGQAGGGMEGANLGACDPLGADGLTAALGSLGVGQVSEINRGIR
jgi:hypothetical protein